MPFCGVRTKEITREWPLLPKTPPSPWVEKNEEEIAEKRGDDLPYVLH